MSEKIQKYYYEFTCLGCKTTWLMEEIRKEEYKSEKPSPKFCPNCGVMFQGFVPKDKEIVF